LNRVVSVSLGTSKRDKREEISLLDQRFIVERFGVDGDLNRFQQLLKELDGKVDAIGFGGCDIYVVAGPKKYAFRQILRFRNLVKNTPVVDGSGLKHSLEREAIQRIQSDGMFDFRGKRVLLVSAVDRFGMAEALAHSSADVVYGDLLFGLGLPIPVRSHSAVRLLGAILLPFITLLPFKWFYPTGEKQEKRTPKHAKYFEQADMICGDWHYIRKFMPDQLPGKVILTQTIRKADLEFLANAGVTGVITTTPVIGGETYATNVMEALIVAYLRLKDSASEPQILEVLSRLDWHPNWIPLNQREQHV
jgi:hypothetical protein